MLFDALAYVMAFAAAGIAGRYDASEKWSYGLHRLEPLSAFLNGVFLVPMVVLILYESYQRVLSPVDIATGPTLAIAAGGLVVNLVSVAVLHDDTELSLNERGALYHLLGDAAGSIAVIVSTIVVEFTEFILLDAFVAVSIAALIIWSSAKLLKGSGAIFLHASPIEPADIRDRLTGHTNIDGVVDVHVWQICSELTIATVHVHASPASLEDANATTHLIHDELADLGVDHATVELCLGDSCSERHLQAHSH